MEIEDALVDSHLPAIEGVGTLTARRLADAEAEELGGHANRTRDLKVLAEGLVLELSADLLEGLNLARGKSDANAVNSHLLGFNGLSTQKRQFSRSPQLILKFICERSPWI